MGMERFEETELRNFWCAVRNLRHAVAENDTEDIDFFVSEIETIARFTEQRLLRNSCYTALSRHYSGRNVAVE